MLDLVVQITSINTRNEVVKPQFITGVTPTMDDAQNETKAALTACG